MNDKIKELLKNAEKTDSLAKTKWRIENREQLREQRKKELKELMDKDKQQTAVDWLFKQLEEKGHVWEETEGVNEIHITVDVLDYLNLKAQAKELEKEKEQSLLNFLYSEITERRSYSASKMCEEVIKFIENGGAE